MRSVFLTGFNRNSQLMLHKVGIMNTDKKAPGRPAKQGGISGKKYGLNIVHFPTQNYRPPMVISQIVAAHLKRRYFCAMCGFPIDPLFHTGTLCRQCEEIAA